MTKSLRNLIIRLDDSRTTELWADKKEDYFGITDEIRHEKKLFGLIPLTGTSTRTELPLRFGDVKKAIDGSFVHYEKKAQKKTKRTVFLRGTVKEKNVSGVETTEISVDKKTNTLIVASGFGTKSSQKLVLHMEDVEYAFRYGYAYHGYDHLRRKEVLWFE